MLAKGPMINLKHGPAAGRACGLRTGAKELRPGAEGNRYAPFLAQGARPASRRERVQAPFKLANEVRLKEP